MKKNLFPAGKLPVGKLNELLRNNSAKGERVVLGPGIGRDAAVIDFGNKYLVAKTDPITFVTDEIGYYAVNINANDIVCTGAKPMWFLVSLLLPLEQADEELVERLFSDIASACRSLEIGLVGGHTEITVGIDRPIVIGQMLGEVEPAKLVRPDRMEMGDVVLLSKGIAIEAVSILAREKESELQHAFGKEFVKNAKSFLHQPGISVYADALLAAAVADIHAFHDPTEGGLATGLHELARAGDVGLEIDQDKIHIFPEAEKICNYFQIDPLGVIASGALLIVAKSKDTSVIITKLNEEGIACQAIGEVIPPENGVRITSSGTTKPLTLFASDEITKILD
jgi:hydrogenase expression/formation protein HypE